MAMPVISDEERKEMNDECLKMLLPELRNKTAIVVGIDRATGDDKTVVTEGRIIFLKKQGKEEVVLEVARRCIL